MSKKEVSIAIKKIGKVLTPLRLSGDYAMTKK
jgi:hypothetical protein